MFPTFKTSKNICNTCTGHALAGSTNKHSRPVRGWFSRPHTISYCNEGSKFPCGQSLLVSSLHWIILIVIQSAIHITVMTGDFKPTLFWSICQAVSLQCLILLKDINNPTSGNHLFEGHYYDTFALIEFNARLPQTLEK